MGKIFKIIIFLIIFTNKMLYANLIDDISANTSNASHQKIIIIHFKDKVTKPRISLSKDENKMFLIFPKSELSIKNKSLTYDDELLRSISSNKVGQDSRIIMSFTNAIIQNTKIKGNNFIVYVNKGRNSNNNIQASRNTNTASTIKTVVNKPIEVNVLFSAGPNKTGIITLRSTNKLPDPKARVLDRKLELLFNNLKIDASSQNSFDVTDFNNIIKNFKLIKIGNSAKIEILTSDNYSYEVSNNANFFEIILKPRVSNFTSDLSGYSNRKTIFRGGKISLDFQDANIRTLLQIIAKESGFNIIVSDNVQGSMTISLHDVPWEQALALILQTKNLEQKREGNIIRVAPRNDFINQEKQIRNAQKEISELGLMESKIFYLKYRKAQEIQDIITNSASSSKNSSASILSGRGNIIADTTINALVVTDNPIVLKKFQKLLNQLDVPSRQVMIEARIVEANEGYSRDLGMKFGMNKSYSKKTRSFGTSGNVELTEEEPFAENSKKKTYDMPLNINLPAVSTSGIGILKQTASSLLYLELSAMQEENKGKVISSPRVLTQDKQSATLEEGEDFPYQEATKEGNTAISFKKAVTGITVTPHITPDGNILMDLKINKDTIIDKNNGRMGVKRVETKAMVENGGTIVVGGIYVEENLSGVDQVPILGDIPVVGRLFKRKNKLKNRRELLVFITPKIVEDDYSAISY